MCIKDTINMQDVIRREVAHRMGGRVRWEKLCRLPQKLLPTITHTLKWIPSILPHV